MQGALPVVAGGQVIGAIGASFATPAEDVQDDHPDRVAKADLAGLGQWLDERARAK